MSKLVDLNSVRSAWAHRYGSARATAMLSGSRGPVAAYDSRYGLRRYGRDASGMDPDDSDMGGGASGGGDDPDMEKIKLFLKNRLDENSWNQLCQMMEALSGGGNGPTTSRQPDPSDDPDDNQPDNGSNSAQPAPFAGRPSPGGQMEKGGRDRRFGQDARPRGYFDSFPANSRVTVES